MFLVAVKKCPVMRAFFLQPVISAFRISVSFFGKQYIDIAVNITVTAGK